MLTIYETKKQAFCDGYSRRDFLRVGALCVGGLSLADLLRLDAQGAVRPRSLKSVIMVYLHGGPSHLDTFDMKPEAPAEFRGEFRPIHTKLPGLEICELMPRLASIADKMSVIRNISFLEYTDGHNPPLVYTGYRTSTAKPTYRPAFGSVVSRFRGDAVRDMPPYVAFDGIDTNPAGRTDYLGASHLPFVPGAQMSGMGPLKGMTMERMVDRRQLLTSFAALQRNMEDARGNLSSADVFTARALEMITTTSARDAFDISKEPEAIRTMYGEKGIQFLQARRLVEAGVQVVTLTANMESQTWHLAGPWDHHRGVFTGLRKMLPEFDQHLYALITDLSQRGLEQEVAVVVWGEMGRTPRINEGAGRDHWNDVGFALVAGGGLKMGQVIGATTSRAEQAVGKPYTPQNMLATLYDNVLGINPAQTYLDYNGRPLYVLDNRERIVELV